LPCVSLDNDSLGQFVIVVLALKATNDNAQADLV
jgi:hypothetical protein